MTLSADQSPFPPYPVEPPSPPPQQRGGPMSGGSIGMGRGNLESNAVPIVVLALTLSQYLGRPVIDKTNLKGLLDIKLQLVREMCAAANPVDGQSPSIDGAFIFTAIEEQLGLRLESAKGPVEVLVIDSVQKPSEN